MSNLNVCRAENRVVYWAVNQAAGDAVYWAVYRAVYWAGGLDVGGALYRDVGGAVEVVNSAVTWTVFADPPHPGLMLYLAAVA